MPQFISKSRRRAIGAAAIVLGFQARAAAQSEELSPHDRDKIRLEYQAPPECPDAETFKGMVGSRVPPGWEAAPEELARRVDVLVSGTHGRYIATIELVDERGERVARAVRGRLCSNVVDGIALVTALAIQSRVEEARDRSEPATTKANAQRTGQGAPATAGRTRRASEASSRLGRTAGSESSGVGVRISARAALATGIGPIAAVGAGLGIVLERRSARLGVVLHGFRARRVESRGIPVRFELFAGRLEGCPIVLTISDWASIEPCPFAEIGQVIGEAFEDPPAVVRGYRESALWFSTGGAGRAVGRFGAAFLELEATVGVPIRRERFYIEGGDEVHRIPAVYGAVAAGLGVRF